MALKLLNIGFGNMVAAHRVVSMVSPESAPIKRIIQDVRERGNLIDATFGRRTRTVIVMDSGHVILSALTPETLNTRLNQMEETTNQGEENDGGTRKTSCDLRALGNRKINGDRRTDGA